MPSKPVFHPLCRPPRGAEGPIDIELVVHDRPLMLGQTKRWRYDNGEPGRAFIGTLKTIEGGFQNVVWVAKCKCTDAKCPRWKALEHAREDLGIESIVIHERPRKGGTRR